MVMPSPSVLPLLKAFNSSMTCRTSGLGGGDGGHQPGHGLSVSGDGEFLALGHPLKELGQVGLSLERSDGFHEHSPIWFQLV